jgi:hypothetical protein
MTLHRMFLFLHNMAGEDTDVLKDTPAIMNKSRIVIARKPWMKDASCLERTSKGFSWQSLNIDITSYCKDTPAITNKSRVVIARKPWMKRLLI